MCCGNEFVYLEIYSYTVFLLPYVTTKYNTLSTKWTWCVYKYSPNAYTYMNQVKPKFNLL